VGGGGGGGRGGGGVGGSGKGGGGGSEVFLQTMVHQNVGKAFFCEHASV